MTTIVNPPYAGQLVDFSNPGSVLLTVDGNPVDLHTDSRFNLVSLKVTYEGKELLFTEVGALTAIDSPTFSNEQPVQLVMVFGSTERTCFSGKIRKVDHNVQNRGSDYTYLAIGTQQLANDVTLLGHNGTPTYYRYAGTHITSVSSGHAIYASMIGETIVDILETNADQLTVQGIPSAVGTPNADYPNGSTLPRDFSLENYSLFDGIVSLAQEYPSRKPYFNDAQSAWTFPDVLDAPTVVVDISSANVTGLPYSMDTTNRWTRIQLQGTFDGYVKVLSKGLVECIPYWNSDLEDTWCMQAAAAEDPQNVPEDGGYTFVYRRWIIPVSDMDDAVNPNAPYCAYALYTYGGLNRYMALDAYIDLSNGLIVTKVPVVVHGNAWAPGRARGSQQVVFTWWRANDLPASNFFYVTYPSSGYTGTAYDLFEIEKTKYEMVDWSEVTYSNAAARLALLKDVIISGDVTIEGDPIEDFLELNSKIIFRHSSKNTCIRSVCALLMGYTYEFGKRGKSTLSLTTDLSGLIRVN